MKSSALQILAGCGNPVSEYPADTLDDLRIDNMSIVVDKEKMDELPVPSLAHSSVNGRSFIVTNNIMRHIKQNKSYLLI